MSTSPSAAMNDERYERACEWFIELRERGQSQEVVAEWLAWCRADPLNRQAFERAREIWQTTEDIDAQDLLVPSSEQLRSLTPRFEVAPLKSKITATLRRRPRLKWGLAAAAALSGVAVWYAALHVAGQSMQASLSTSSGENRLERLADGSTVTLGAGTRVTVDFDRQVRRLTLVSGEAYFKVAPNRERPFTVQAGDLKVTAIGTAFNVRTGSDRVVVAVAEGVVAIEPPKETTVETTKNRLAGLEGKSGFVQRPVLHDTLRAVAGQEVAVDRTVEQLQVNRVEPATIASWQNGRLEFVREPLRAVIASVNRYSKRRITIGDAGLNELRFTGTVFSDRVEDWLGGLPAIFAIEIRDNGATIDIVARDTASRAPNQGERLR